MCKLAKLFELLLKFSQQLPKVNNRPIDKNSPNLVTLIVASALSSWSSCRGWHQVTAKIAQLKNYFFWRDW
jgi:hypothetical protein